MQQFDLKKLGIIAIDDRGWMAEISKVAIAAGQTIENIHTGTIAVGQTRGNHFHKKQKEWMLLLNGKALFAWKANGEIKQKEVSSDERILFEFEEECPHAIKNISDHEIFLCAFANQEYDANEPDRFSEKLID